MSFYVLTQLTCYFCLACISPLVYATCFFYSVFMVFVQLGFAIWGATLLYGQEYTKVYNDKIDTYRSLNVLIWFIVWLRIIGMVIGVIVSYCEGETIRSSYEHNMGGVDEIEYEISETDS